MGDRKRAFEESGPSIVSKKARRSTSSNGPDGLNDKEALIAQKRAEIAAKLAAMRSSSTTAFASPVSRTPAPTLSSSTGTSAASAHFAEDVGKRIVEAKRKVTEAQNKLAVKDNPYMSVPPSRANSRSVEPAPQGAGLKMAAHPLLLDTSIPAPQSKKDRYKPMQPKFASIRANARNAPTPQPAPSPAPAVVKENPYAAAAASATGDTGLKARRGKYMSIANQIRQDAQLEALKQRIAESARKAGLDSEFDTLEKNIRREVPPIAEWWDAPLLPTGRYSDLDEFDPAYLKIRTENSPITFYIQHPIPIPAPGDKNKPPPKPLMLTKKEQKKMRKQRRQAELQDKRDRIRMGLIPPDPPKVRLSNLMKVLTSDAVQDPTRVEARVRREVAMRKHTHDKMNAERKLSDEQRRENLETKKAEEDKKGIFGAVYKISNLSDPAHRFKVRKNAEQMALTGLVIFNPAFSMVYVEGAAKFTRSYKRLMLHRIAWTEAARARGEEEVELADGENGIEGGGGETGKASVTPPSGEVSLEGNRCDLVWEGPIRERAFTNFRPKSCPTDSTARDALGLKLMSYWDMAKNFKPEDEEWNV
ncbi:pre-mRNA processing factor 3-domain-containing protein [Multifurca ochricompacta]|uniref:Pre-mRNA processing factor 3-domain-containing protein n=1 Tax=Multifurca ochricompacta TaxID=376703 RepID=A0AAD4M7E3_9AGAM|nr:pre-mRNA processing factor 3-domain-containing protein [Multifurca ochricompacta]